MCSIRLGLNRRISHSLCTGSLALLIASPGAAAPAPPPSAASKPNRTGAARPSSSAPAHPVLKGEDVVATVEGQPITRRQLTYFWLQVDRRVPTMLGNLLADRWRTDKGAAHAYTLTDTAIYQQLYADPDPALGNILTSLITNRLVALEAARKGIKVTEAEGWARAHELFDDYRQKTKTQASDAQLMAQFHVPRDVFLEDMFFRVRSEKLLAADMAAHHEPAVAPDAWKQVASTRMPAFLAELRKKAKITSTIPLPPVEQPPTPPSNDTAQ